jgi:hypothetical protein
LTVGRRVGACISVLTAELRHTYPSHRLAQTLTINREFWAAMVAVGFIWYQLPISAEQRQNSSEDTSPWHHDPGLNSA